MDCRDSTEIANAGAEFEVLEKVRSARRQLVKTGPAAARSAGDFRRVALPYADADVLRDLITAEGATTVIEVGLPTAPLPLQSQRPSSPFGLLAPGT